MPVHPSEEETHTGITEQVAKDPSSQTESTASTHDSRKSSDLTLAISETASTDYALFQTRMSTLQAS